jgi:hypothetical protein
MYDRNHTALIEKCHSLLEQIERPIDQVKLDTAERTLAEIVAEFEAIRTLYTLDLAVLDHLLKATGHHDGDDTPSRP